jgi:anaerobic magnesium-protoporphyrin IX monomethyl ester cyclase
MNKAVKRVLLLNPPFHKRIIRDNLCCFTAKSAYLWPPADLLYLSGLFSYTSSETRIIDAVASRMSHQKLDAEITAFAPDLLIMLTGSVSWKDDLAAIQPICEKNGISLIVTGNLPVFTGRNFLEKFPFVHAILHDFFDSAAINWLISGGEVPPTVSTASFEGKFGKGEIELPDDAVPEYSKFPLHRYHIPFMKAKPMVSALASFGCLQRCSFCSAASLPYRKRTESGMKAEFAAMKKAGVREVFFEDPAFNFDKEHTIAVCNALKSEGGLSWSANIHAKFTDEEQLTMMKEAACHTLMIGVESGNPRFLEEYAPAKNHDDVLRTVSLCKKLGIKTLAYYILGFPQETKETVKKTIAFAIELDTDLASFSFLTPDFGTRLRKELHASGKLPADQDAFDSSEASPFAHEFISDKDLRRLMRKAYRKFYLRPRKLLQLAFSATGWKYGYSYLAAFINNRLL